MEHCFSHFQIRVAQQANIHVLSEREIVLLLAVIFGMLMATNWQNSAGSLFFFGLTGFTKWNNLLLVAAEAIIISTIPPCRDSLFKCAFVFL